MQLQKKSSMIPKIAKKLVRIMRKQEVERVRKLKEISFANNNNLEIFCITPWGIEKLKVEIGHF